MEQRHVGRRVLVTGAGSGIGRATALRFGAEGARVACLDVAGDAAEATAAAVREAGGAVMAMACDVADAASVEACVAAVVAAFGGLDVVCNIAGIGSFARSEEVDPEQFRRILDVNLYGTFLVSRFALPHLLESHGQIVNTASNAGLMGQPYSAAYCASKGGVVLLTKAMAVEYQNRRVRVNAIAPGGTRTQLIKSFRVPEGADVEELAKMMTPMPVAEPGEIAAAFAYVASDEARYMTGTILSIDGGITA